MEDRRSRAATLWQETSERHADLRFSGSAQCGCGEPDCTCDAGVIWPTDRELPVEDQTASVLAGVIRAFDNLPTFHNVPVRLVLALESARTYLQQTYDQEIKP